MIDRLNKAGTELRLLNLIRYLDRTRVQPSLCLLDGEDDLSRSLEPTDCPVLRLGIRSLHHPSTVVSAWRLARFLRSQRTDVLQVSFPDTTYLGTLVGLLARVPFVFQTRYDLGEALTPLHKRLHSVASRFANGTLVNCEACRQFVLRTTKHREANVVLLENGVDLSRFARLPLPNPDRPPGGRVGLVANLRAVKNPALFVQAAQRLLPRFPSATFLLAGEGELRGQLDDMIKRGGMEGRTQLLGAVSDVPALLATLDVAALTSNAEGQSNAVIEYMAAGRPVVATAVGGNVELIDHGKTGLLVPPGDPDAMAAAIGELLGDPAKAAQIGAAGREKALAKYGVEMMAARYAAFIARATQCRH